MTTVCPQDQPQSTQYHRYRQDLSHRQPAIEKAQLCVRLTEELTEDTEQAVKQQEHPGVIAGRLRAAYKQGQNNN